MANIGLLTIPVYDVKTVEASFDLPDMDLKKVEIHPLEWDANIVFLDGKGKVGTVIPTIDIIGTDLVAEAKGIFKKEKRLVEIIFKAGNSKQLENKIRIQLDDKYEEEFLKKIEVLRQTNSNASFWTCRSLSFETGSGHVGRVDIYPLVPFLADGEELVWYNLGISKKKIVRLQALTNYRIYFYDYVKHAGTVVLMPGLQDVVVMNQRRASSSNSVGIYAGSRFNITGFRNSSTTSLTVGDVQFIAEGKPYITLLQVGDPHGLARLVKSLKQQQAHVKIVGRQIQLKPESVQHGIKKVLSPESCEDNIKCLQCNSSNPHGSEFCNMCGSKLKLGCPKCGQKNPDQSKFCNKCGFALA